MNTINKIIGMCLAVVLTVNITTAQRIANPADANDAKEYAQKQTDKMAEQLSLTKGQQKKVLKVNMAYIKNMNEAKADGNRDATKAIREERNTAIKAILKPDQLAKFEELKGSKANRGGKGDRAGRGNGQGRERDPEARAKERTERMTEQLGLSTTQADQITEINMIYGEKMRALRDSDDREAAFAERKILREQQNTAIKAVLNDKQVALYNEMLENRASRGGEGRGRGGEGRGGRGGNR